MNFLQDYVLFNSGNEAPRNYHVWCGLAALSSAISRRVWVDMGYFRVYTNLYIVLCGNPGIKKTTAMTSAKTLVRELGDVPFSAECQTKESLVKEWQDYQRTFKLNEADKPLIYTPLSIFSTELSHFLGPQSGHMIDFLVTVFDGEFYDTKTKNKGTDLVLGPYITMLACTTPEWINTYLKTDIITGGFSRRAIFVLEFKNADPIPFPEITPEMRAGWDRALAHAHTLRSLCGPFMWEPEARAFWSDWYKKHHNHLRDNPPDPNLRGFLGTKDVQVLKVAMLIAIADYNPKLMLTVDMLQTALALFDTLEANLPKVFQGMGRNELNSVSAKVLALLEAHGPMLDKKLKAAMWSDAQGFELASVLSHLYDTGRIVRLEERSQTTGQTIKSFILLAEHKEKFMKELNERQKESNKT